MNKQRPTSWHSSVPKPDKMVTMTDESRRRVFSAMQPTADSLHLGNYLGALVNWVDLQERYDTIFSVVDLHALTVAPDPDLLRERTRRTAAQYIAAGIDPERSIVFAQSHVAEHTQLTWLLSCLTGFGEAARMTQFKDKSAKQGRDAANVGLFTYPILQAADILLYDVDLVPVGEDQRQHLELSRTLAERLNHRYGPLVTVPQPHIVTATAKIYDLQQPTAKMSKSSSSPNGIIELLDPEKTVAKRIRSAVTDNENRIVFDADAQPGVANLLTINSALSGRPIQEIVEEFSGQGYGHLKVATAEVVTQRLAPVRERAEELLADADELDEILADGADRARAIARGTLDRIHDAIGILPERRA